jgi:hypothetical protein
MKNMERREFEEAWKRAFEDAGYSPSEKVWTNIELELEKEKASQLKRRLVFYQLLAAASVVFAISIALGMYSMNKRQQSELASNAVSTKPDKKVSPDASGPSGQKRELQQQNVTTDKVNSENDGNTSSSFPRTADVTQDEIRTTSEIGQVQGKGPTDPSFTEESIALTDQKNNIPRHTYVEEVFTSSRERKLPPLTKEVRPRLVQSSATAVVVAPDPLAQMLDRLRKREQELKEEGDKEEKKNEGRQEEKLWTSIGFAAGSFNSVNSGAPALMQESLASADHAHSYASASIANQEAKASGVTYSMGVNLGTKLSERWVFQGGVNYLTQTSDYTQNNVLVNQDFTAFRAANINDIEKTSENIVNTPPHDVNNNVRYLSIPLQAGFLIFNRDFGVQLNAGVATDLFLQNTITATANGEKIDASKAGIGEDSAFRPVNLSGLMGTEVSYRFGRHYRIALNPGLKYPFNSIYKSEEYKATRLSFDVGLRFRYIFH